MRTEHDVEEENQATIPIHSFAIAVQATLAYDGDKVVQDEGVVAGAMSSRVRRVGGEVGGREELVRMPR